MRLSYTHVFRDEPVSRRIPPQLIDIRDEEDEDEDSELHVIPETDVFPHRDDYTCPCQPELCRTPFGKDVWVHKELKDGLN